MERQTKITSVLPVRRMLIRTYCMIFTILLFSGVPIGIAHAQGGDLVVKVDGREVTVENVQAELGGQQASLEEVLARLGPDPVTAELVEIDEGGVGKPLENVKAVIHNKQIDFTDLSPELAAHGRIGIWISGSNWRICVVITWGSVNNPTVAVDGREVDVEEVEAQIDGAPVRLQKVLELLGNDPVTAEKVELHDPANDGPIEAPNVQAVLTGNHIELTELSPELATRGRIGIWISSSNWRICIVIKWGSRVNPEVSVDGHKVDVEEVEAQIDDEMTEFRRVLELLGDEVVTAEKVEVYDPSNDAPIAAPNAQAMLKGSYIELTGLSPELAEKGRIGIWISSSRWRICIVIKWGSRVNPEVSVDGRKVDVEEVQAQIDGEMTEFRRVLELLGDEPVTADKVEFYDPAGISASSVLTSPIDIPEAKAVLKGNHIELTGLSPELAARGRIGVWISGSNWRICIVITWGSRVNPEVSVDGRKVDVEEVQAQIDGEMTEFRRVLELLDDEVVIAEKVEVYDPSNDAPIAAPNAQAMLKGSYIELTGLSPELAEKGRIGIWISGQRWRICIVITWGSRVNPEVSVDGRKVDVEEVEAQIDGEMTEFRRVLELLGDEPVTADKVEFYDPADISASSVLTSPIDIPEAKAVLKGNHIELTGLSPELAARGRIGVWISGQRWRICVVITWGSRVNPEVSVDGRKVDIEEVEAQIDGETTELRRVLELIGDEPVTAKMVEVLDPTNNSPIAAPNAQAILKGNHIELTGLSPELAARGRIGIWISGQRWRICVVITWGSRVNPEVSVDGHKVDVEEVEAQIDGEMTEFRRVLELLGDEPVTAEMVEIYDPSDISASSVLTDPIEMPDVMAVLKGNHIELTGLAPELAARGRIGVWISGKRWRICVVITWGSRVNPEVSVDGRKVDVEEVEARIDGEATELRRVLELLGDEVVTAEEVEVYDPATDGSIAAPNAQAMLRGSHIELIGLSPELAEKGRIGIWISGKRWRICVVITWGSRVNPEVSVDGRKVDVEEVEAQIDGESTELRRVLELLGDEPVTAELVEIYDPSDIGASTVFTDPVEMPDVMAVLEGNHIELTGLSPELAARGRIGVWISGKRWRICVVITWGSRVNPEVSVDGRKVDVEEVQAQVDGESTELRRVLELLGDEAVTAEKVEVYNPSNDAPIAAPNVQAMLKGSHIELTGLSPELAAKGRIGIWISGERWRICIVIKWGSRVNLEVSVDGRKVDVEEVEAQIDGESTELRRVLELLGDKEVTAEKVEFYDPAGISASSVLTSPINIPEAKAVLKGSHIELTGLSPELAARGRIGVWISGKRWRICVVITWGSRVNPEVSVDGRKVDVEEVEAQIDGEATELRRVLELLGDEAVTAEKVEVHDPVNDSPIVAPNAQAVLKGSYIDLTGVSPELAARGRIGVWISGSNWRICIVIKWGSRVNPEVSVDGRKVDVEEVQAQVDGEMTELRRVLELLGDETVTADKVEVYKPADIVASTVLTEPIDASNVTAVLTGNQIKLSELANPLALHKRIGIWISGSNWRICIVIKLGSSDRPRVTVDGRGVTTVDTRAELDGEQVEPHRVFAFLDDDKVVPDTIEIVADGQDVSATGVEAEIVGQQIKLTNLADTLAQHGRISVWIGGSNWRICITIEWGRFKSTDGNVELDLPAVEAHDAVSISYTAISTPTQSLPSGKKHLRVFTIDAANDAGQPVTQLDGTYSLVVKYTDAELAELGIEEESLVVAYLDEETGEWVQVPTEADTENNCAVGTLDHFTEFALWGDEDRDNTVNPGQTDLFLPLITK